MSIMLKRAKFEYLSENVISKLIQRKAIFIEVGRRMSIYNYYRYIIIMFQRNFMETLDNFFFIEGNQSLCFMINKYNFTIYYFMKLLEKILLLFRNKIETGIYVIIFDTIRYFIYIFGSTNLLGHNAPMILFTMMNTVAVFCGESSSNSFFHKCMEESVGK